MHPKWPVPVIVELRKPNNTIHCAWRLGSCKLKAREVILKYGTKLGFNIFIRSRSRTFLELTGYDRDLLETFNSSPRLAAEQLTVLSVLRGNFGNITIVVTLHLLVEHLGLV